MCTLVVVSVTGMICGLCIWSKVKETPDNNSTNVVTSPTYEDIEQQQADVNRAMELELSGNMAYGTAKNDCN